MSEVAWPEAAALAERLVAATGSAVRVVLLYGSRLLKTRPDPHSAVDFVVIVDGYRPFYRALSAAGQLHRPVGLMTGLSRVLPPNTLAFAPDESGAIAKCLVVSKSDFERALGPTPPDHFLLGRMVQQVGEVWAADDDEFRWARAQISGAHMRVLDWMAPYLTEAVDGAALGRRLLEVCYRGELRPESRGRAGAISDAQSQHFAAVLTPMLERSVATGLMTEDSGRYALVEPASPSEVRRWKWHFRRSKTRATLRWFKHVVTFANWLPYVVRKVERHTGRTIELTALERAVPIIFLWPRVIHILLTRPRREIES